MARTKEWTGGNRRRESNSNNKVTQKFEESNTQELQAIIGGVIGKRPWLLPHLKEFIGAFPREFGENAMDYMIVDNYLQGKIFKVGMPMMGEDDC